MMWQVRCRHVRTVPTLLMMSTLFKVHVPTNDKLVWFYRTATSSKEPFAITFEWVNRMLQKKKLTGQ